MPRPRVFVYEHSGEQRGNVRRLKIERMKGSEIKYFDHNYVFLVCTNSDCALREYSKKYYTDDCAKRIKRPFLNDRKAVEMKLV